MKEFNLPLFMKVKPDALKELKDNLDLNFPFVFPGYSRKAGFDFNYGRIAPKAGKKGYPHAVAAERI